MWLVYATLIVLIEGGGRHEGSGAGSWWARWVEPCLMQTEIVRYALAKMTMERQT